MNTDLLPQYGSWTVLGPVFRPPGPGYNYRASCRCVCGAVKDVRVDLLRRGLSVSCNKCKTGRKRTYPSVVTGMRFKRLVALGPPRRHPVNPTGFLVDCRCDCGMELAVQVQSLQRGQTGQCAKCRDSEEVRKWRCDYHLLGQSSPAALDRLKNIHGGMLDRCYNPRDRNYKNYGARGIDIALAWRDSVAVFLEWAVRQPGHDLLTHSIDRIDNNKGYAPENCRFATDEVQLNNKRNNVLITYRGETFTASQFLRAHCPWCSAQAGIQYLKRNSPEDTIEHYRPKENNEGVIKVAPIIRAPDPLRPTCKVCGVKPCSRKCYKSDGQPVYHSRCSCCITAASKAKRLANGTTLSWITKRDAPGIPVV